MSVVIEGFPSQTVVCLLVYVLTGIGIGWNIVQRFDNSFSEVLLVTGQQHMQLLHVYVC